MAQNTCDCTKTAIEIPVLGLSLKLDAEAFPEGGTGPSVPGVDYSLEEQWTGKRWIDGKKIYQITVELGVLPNKTTRLIPHNLADYDQILHYFGHSHNPGQNNFINVPHPAPQGVAISIIGPNIQLSAAGNYSAQTESYLTFWYTKTAD